mgnify:FL=1
MVSIWGLVNLAGSLLPGMDNNRPPLPTFGPAETAPAGASTNTINAGGGANATSGSKNLGDSCSATNGCGDGLSCVSGSCRPYGETIAPVACPSGNCIPGTNIPANLEGLY